MPIDGCPHTFRDLSSTVLPSRLRQLKAAMRRPYRMALFAQAGIGTSGLLHLLKLPADFPGCYVLLDGRRPVYVGISRSVIQRLQQHVKGRTHFSASLAYRIAAHGGAIRRTRTAAMDDNQFRTTLVGRNAIYRASQLHLCP